MIARFTVSIPNRKLVEDFRKACKSRGRSQSYVIMGAMKYFIAHPNASGNFGNGGDKELAPKAKGGVLETTK